MKNKGIVLVITLLLIAVMMYTGGCGLFGGDQGSPEKVVEAYFKAFQNKDFKTAVDYTLRGEGFSDSDLEMLESVFENFRIVKYEVGKADMLSNDEALVPVSLITSFNDDESSSTDDIRVVKRDGKWFIDDGVDDDDDWDDRTPPDRTPDSEEIIEEPDVPETDEDEEAIEEEEDEEVEED